MPATPKDHGRFLLDDFYRAMSDDQQRTFLRGVAIGMIIHFCAVTFPLFAAFDETAGRAAFCRRCSDDFFSARISDSQLETGFWVFAVAIASGLAAQLLASRLRSSTPDQPVPVPMLWRLARGSRALLPYFFATILVWLPLPAQPARFYYLLACAGYAVTMLVPFIYLFGRSSFKAIDDQAFEAITQR